jgi:DNA-binding NarL/FixJ family response regulator
VHALTTIGVSEANQGLDAGWAKLEASAERAVSAGLEEDAARALINLVEAGKDLRRYDRVDQYLDKAMAYVVDHDLDLYRRRLTSDLAEVALERGRWDEAAERANALVAESRTAPVVRAKALAVIGRLRARRGHGDPWAPLDEALALIGPSGDTQDLCPTYAARSEAAWLQGDDARAEARRGLAQAVLFPGDAWWLGEAGFWAWRAGLIEQLPDGSAQPYLLHAAGDHREAALAWQRVGCPYHQAQALTDSADEGELRHALELSHALGAQPLARLASGRLRAIGAVGIARGPRHSTRRNPLSLTDREVEVLTLLSDELSNAEIAERLVVSPKTVDHHVAAIFRKLGVHDRAAARDHAARLKLKDRQTREET